MWFKEKLSQRDYQQILIEMKLREELFELIQAENNPKVWEPLKWVYGLAFGGFILLIPFAESPGLIIGILGGICLALTPPAVQGFFRLWKAKRNYAKDELRIRSTEWALNLRFDSKLEIFWRDEGAWQSNRFYFDPFLNRCWQDDEPKFLTYKELKGRYDENGDLIDDEYRNWQIGGLVGGMNGVMNGRYLDSGLFNSVNLRRYQSRQM